MFEDDSVRIRHILDADREAVAFSQGRSRGDLDTDRKLNLSMVRLLEVIGEAARGIFHGISAGAPGFAMEEYARSARPTYSCLF